MTYLSSAYLLDIAAVFVFLLHDVVAPPRRAWTSRGELELPSRDNRKVAMEILALRSEQARMHGYENYAAYSTADTMAQTPAKVMELLEVRSYVYTYIRMLTYLELHVPAVTGK